MLYVDLHGHSRKKNAFFYGCSYKGYGQENTQPVNGNGFYQSDASLGQQNTVTSMTGGEI